MRFFNKHLLYFILAVIGYTIIFRYALSYGLSTENYYLVWGGAIAYFFALFFTGKSIGQAYYDEYLGNDLGLTWHAATFIFATLTSYLWLKFGPIAPGESFPDLWGVTLGWGIGLFVHFIVFLFARPRSIKGISKDEIFD